LPLFETVINWLVDPFDQVFPVAFEDVKVTDPPEQNVVGPLDVIVGIVGTAFTVIALVDEDELHVPFETLTE
jgi:hypothetical protein